MKPHLQKIQLLQGQSFNVYLDKGPHFYNRWHYHPELELLYVLKGTGRQFIGNHIHHFKPGDMVLMGANLPHLWHSDEKYFRGDDALETEALGLHFTTDCLGAGFFHLPENKALQTLLERSHRAVRIKNQTRDVVAALMRELLAASGADRIILLLQILRVISHSTETRLLCSQGFQFMHDPGESERLDAIYQYILDNFTGQISLEQIAQVAHMSPNAFCRYFKSRIKKTFSRFLLEVRVGHAAKLLAETTNSVADVCYDSGFNNFSNFNRHFKEIIGQTPLAHRKHYQELKHEEMAEEV